MLKIYTKNENICIKKLIKKLNFLPVVQFTSSYPSQQSITPSHNFVCEKQDIKCPQRNCFVKSQSVEVKVNVNFVDKVQENQEN